MPINLRFVDLTKELEELKVCRLGAKLLLYFGVPGAFIEMILVPAKTSVDLWAEIAILAIAFFGVFILVKVWTDRIRSLEANLADREVSTK